MKALPKRCTTCGGKGYFEQPDFIGAEPTKQRCTDCIEGISGWIVSEETDGDT